MDTSTRRPGRSTWSVVNRTPLLLMFTVLPAPASSPDLRVSTRYFTSRSIGKRSAPRRSLLSRFVFNSLSPQGASIHGSLLLPGSVPSLLELRESNNSCSFPFGVVPAVFRAGTPALGDPVAPCLRRSLAPCWPTVWDTP